MPASPGGSHLFGTRLKSWRFGEHLYTTGACRHDHTHDCPFMGGQQEQDWRPEPCCRISDNVGERTSGNPPAAIPVGSTTSFEEAPGHRWKQHRKQRGEHPDAVAGRRDPAGKFSRPGGVHDRTLGKRAPVTRRPVPARPWTALPTGRNRSRTRQNRGTQNRGTEENRSRQSADGTEAASGPQDMRSCSRRGVGMPGHGLAGPMSHVPCPTAAPRPTDGQQNVPHPRDPCKNDN